MKNNEPALGGEDRPVGSDEAIVLDPLDPRQRRSGGVR